MSDRKRWIRPGLQEPPRTSAAYKPRPVEADWYLSDDLKVGELITLLEEYGFPAQCQRRSIDRGTRDYILRALKQDRVT